MFWTTVPAHFGFSMKGFWNEDFNSCISLGSSSAAALYSFMNHKMCLDSIPLLRELLKEEKRERCIVSHIIFQKVFCNTSHHIKTKLLLFPPKVPWGVGGLSFRQLRVQPTTYLSAERLHLAVTFTFPTNSQSIPRVFKHTVKMMLSKYPNNCLS